MQNALLLAKMRPLQLRLTTNITDGSSAS